jgi:hypothetical protein
MTSRCRTSMQSSGSSCATISATCSVA